MRIRYRKAALADLENIRRYIRKSNPLAARRVVLEIREQVALLQSLGKRFREGPVEGTRELLILKYGYVVTYTVDAGLVEILSVFHAAQDKPRGG